MLEEYIQSGPNEEVNQEHYDYIELWFQKIIGTKRPCLLQQLFPSYLSKQLVSHTLVYFKEYFSNVSMSMFVILLRTWLHLKEILFYKN